MSNTFGAVFALYQAEVESWTGYTANERINDATYQPASTAHKGFFLEFISNTVEGEETGRMTGNTELTVLKFILKILFYYKKSQTFAQNERDTWNSIDAAKKELYSFAGSHADQLWIESITKESIESDFKLVTITGNIGYQWSMI